MRTVKVSAVIENVSTKRKITDYVCTICSARLSHPHFSNDLGRGSAGVTVWKTRFESLVPIRGDQPSSSGRQGAPLRPWVRGGSTQNDRNLFGWGFRRHLYQEGGRWRCGRGWIATRRKNGGGHLWKSAARVEARLNPELWSEPFACISRWGYWTPVSVPFDSQSIKPTQSGGRVHQTCAAFFDCLRRLGTGLHIWIRTNARETFFPGRGHSGERYVKPILFGSVVGSNLVEWNNTEQNYGRSGEELVSEQSAKRSDGEGILSWPWSFGIRFSTTGRSGFARAKSGEFVEVKVKEPGEQRKLAPERYQAIEIRLSKGRSLLVEPGFDASHLRALLAVLETKHDWSAELACVGSIRRARGSGWQQRRRTCAVALIVWRSEWGRSLVRILSATVCSYSARVVETGWRFWLGIGMDLFCGTSDWSAGVFKLAADERGIALGRVAGQRAGDDPGWDRYVEAEAGAALRANQHKQHGKCSWISYPQRSYGITIVVPEALVQLTRRQGSTWRRMVAALLAEQSSGQRSAHRESALQVELERYKKWYYGPRADRLQTEGELAQMLLRLRRAAGPEAGQPGRCSAAFRTGRKNCGAWSGARDGAILPTSKIFP